MKKILFLLVVVCLLTISCNSKDKTKITDSNFEEPELENNVSPIVNKTFNKIVHDMEIIF